MPCLSNSIRISHLVSHLVRLHHWRFLHYRSQEVWQQVPELAANGFSGLVVHEEIHLFGADLFKLILEGVYSFDFDCTVRQTAPSIQYTDREEVKSCITCTVSFNQFPTVATSVSSISYLKISLQWNWWKASYHLEQFDQICTIRYDTIEEINVDSKAEYTA